MDSNKANDSLDKQVNLAFRKRSRTKFWTALVAVGSFLTGCFAKDIAVMPNPVSLKAKAETHKKTLPDLASAIPHYDPVTKTTTTVQLYDPVTKTYDTAGIKAEADRQLELSDPKDSTSYKNLFDYSNLDHLLATRYALGKVIEQNEDYIKVNESDVSKKLEVEKKQKENQELKATLKLYSGALKIYKEVGAADKGRSDKDRMRCSLALGLEAYAEGTKESYAKWDEIRRDRVNDFGLYTIGEEDDFEYVGIRNMEGLESALANREAKVSRNKKIAFWATLGGILIGVLASNNDDNGGSYPSNGGEDGGEGGR